MDYNKEFAEAVDKGLTSPQKTLPTRFIYDKEGSKLFEQIMDLPEYYLTKAEHEILQSHKEEIARFIGDEKFNLVELGAGNGEKTKTLLKYFLDSDMEFRYVPIDISNSAVDGLTNHLQNLLPELQVEGLTMEYFEGLNWVKDNSERRNLVLFLGSNIGNFVKPEIDRFLTGLNQSMKSGDMVAIGFDLKKDYETIRKAYYDSAGVTKAFNLNIVKRINAELGANFDMENMDYYSMYNPKEGRNEAYLYSKIKQIIQLPVLNKEYSIEAFEPINTEYSYKFSLNEIEGMASEHGYKVLAHMMDDKRQFVDSLWLL